MKAGITKTSVWNLKAIWAEKEVDGFNSECNQPLEHTGPGNGRFFIEKEEMTLR